MSDTPYLSPVREPVITQFHRTDPAFSYLNFLCKAFGVNHIKNLFSVPYLLAAVATGIGLPSYLSFSTQGAY